MPLYAAIRANDLPAALMTHTIVYASDPLPE